MHYLCWSKDWVLQFINTFKRSYADWIFIRIYLMHFFIALKGNQHFYVGLLQLHTELTGACHLHLEGAASELSPTFVILTGKVQGKEKKSISNNLLARSSNFKAYAVKVLVFDNKKKVFCFKKIQKRIYLIEESILTWMKGPRKWIVY